MMNPMANVFRPAKMQLKHPLLSAQMIKKSHTPQERATGDHDFIKQNGWIPYPVEVDKPHASEEKKQVELKTQRT